MSADGIVTLRGAIVEFRGDVGRRDTGRVWLVAGYRLAAVERAMDTGVKGAYEGLGVRFGVVATFVNGRVGWTKIEADEQIYLSR